MGRSCRKPSRRNRSRKRCTRYKKVGTLTRNRRRAGSNRIPFSGRLGLRPLSRGTHRASVVATDGAGNKSRTKRARFVIAGRE